MKKLVITGGKKLSGSINISGSKNAILPILASTILNEDKVFLTNVPIVNDVETMVRLLSILGSDIQINKFKKTIEISNYNKLNTFAPYQLLKTMRAGILVLGPLLAKYRKAKVSLPGGCAIGSRPVDLHLEAFRKNKKAEAEKAGIKITPLSFLIKAAAKVLEAFPHINSSLSGDGENLVIKKYYHIGFATNTPKGLMVPVIKNADQKGIYEISSEIMALAQKARQGKLKPEEMKGATFTISSLGILGTTAFTPIINMPEVAIMGVSKAAIKPVWNGENFVPRTLLPLSLSADHRVIDGAMAATFLTQYAATLSDVREMLL